MNLPVIVLGGGGHAKVLMDALQQLSIDVLGFTRPYEADVAGILGVKFLGQDDIISNYTANQVRVINGVGSVGDVTIRRDLYLKYRSLGYEFANIVHPHAYTSPTTRFGLGLQIMAGVVVQTNTAIGENVLLNTSASVDHDCVIQDHVHIAPGATLCGGVFIGEGTHVGAGATIVQGVRVGRNCLIAAGAVVLRDVPDGATVVGVPGREIAR